MYFDLADVFDRLPRMKVGRVYRFGGGHANRSRTRNKQPANTDGRRSQKNVLYGPCDLTTRSRFNLPDSPQPIWLMEELLFMYTPPGGSVLEIGSGAGTGAIAAHKLGFDYLGIERDETMMDAAIRRVLEFKDKIIPEEERTRYLTRQLMQHRRYVQEHLSQDLKEIPE